MDKTSYAMGMSIARNMIQSGVRELSYEDFLEGIKVSFTGGKPAISYQEAGKLLNEYFAKLEIEQASLQAEKGAKMLEEGEAFLKVNAKAEGVKVTASGLQYKVLRKGTGKKPGPQSKVKCHYEGTFLDGTKFDSSYDRKEPAVFGVNQVIAGWTEALQMMSEGAEWQLFIPYQLAYGEAGAHGSIPPYACLVFKVELLEVL